MADRAQGPEENCTSLETNWKAAVEGIRTGNESSCLGNWLLHNTSSNETFAVRSLTYSFHSGTMGQAVTR